MKILKSNNGALTNFEVLQFLRSKGASADCTRVLSPIAQSEFQVYDYLVQKAACNQTPECIHEFLKRCEKYNLAKAEKLNIINIRPSSVVEIYPIIESCEERLGDESVEELVEMIAEVLPPAPNSGATHEDETMEEVQEAATVDQIID